MFPDKLKKGDEIRVIAPARSLGILSKHQIEYATKVLNDMGFKVTFGKHVKTCDEFFSSSIESRIYDLHDAFCDGNVKGILTVIGGFNSNQLLKYIDYGSIRDNPKVLCGYSDITALSNAIYAKTGLVTYYGPHFSTFGMEKGNEYTIEYFKKCLMNEEEFEILPSETWSDDEWYLNQDYRHFIDNDGYTVIHEGECEGTIIGGNLCTLNLLQGTEFFPGLKDSVLFLEDDYLTNYVEWDRNLQSIIHLPGFDQVKGIVIGRFQNKSAINMDIMRKIIDSKKELDALPVICNVNFGHVSPILTVPIGGKVFINAHSKEASLKIEKRMA
ncbi:MAG: LD-carboxypeptidase [Oscillospiraceae bacterium]|nr:LD-carboxypeptidase [Oscillospiraceae bacterium]